MLLHDYFDFYGRTKPNAEFAVDGNRALTYGEALRHSNRLANALIGAGLAKGDRFGFLAKNSIEYALLYFAASRAGVVPVPLNYRLAAAEWRFILEDAGAKLLIADQEYCESVEPALENISTRIVLGGSSPGWSDYSDWIGRASDFDPQQRVADAADVIQMYTSGTTGRPKGAVLTHYSVTSNVAQFAPLCRDYYYDRTLLTAPLYHIAAACVLFSAAYAGASMLIHRDFIPAQAVKALSDDGVGMALLVPAMIHACAAVPGAADRDYRRLRCIGYGASAISEVTLRRAMEVFGCDFLQAYGLTETSPVVTILTPDEHRLGLSERPELLLSAGRAVPGTNLIIADPDGNPVPNGRIGEIAVRGPQLMRCYWNRPEATAETIRGGRLFTGDAATIDDDGFIYIQDRVKDMIVSGGENIYPREVEEALFEHPHVADVAVIGIPSAQWGETVHAVLVAKGDERPDHEAVGEFCRKRLGGYKIPRSVEWIDALPRNPSGKVLKRVLREKFWEGQGRNVGGN